MAFRKNPGTLLAPVVNRQKTQPFEDALAKALDTARGVRSQVRTLVSWLQTPKGRVGLGTQEQAQWFARAKDFPNGVPMFQITCFL